MLIIAKNRKNYPEFPSFLFVRFLTKTSGTLEARSERSLRLCNNNIILGLLEGDRLDAHVFRPEESDQAVQELGVDPGGEIWKLAQVAALAFEHVNGEAVFPRI
jgi:hypothetical protein